MQINSASKLKLVESKNDYHLHMGSEGELGSQLSKNQHSFQLANRVGNLLLSRCEVVINRGFEEVLQKSQDLNFRVKCDPVLKSIHQTQIFSADFASYQIRVNGKFPVSDRILNTVMYTELIDENVRCTSGKLTARTTCL